VRAGAATIVPVVAERRRSGTAANTLWVHGERFPVAVVVKRETELRAFMTDGTEHDPDAVIRAVPGLAAALEADDA
jgi:hypothetical protein